MKRTMFMLSLKHSTMDIFQHILIIQMLLCFEVTFALQFRRLGIPNAIPSGTTLYLHCDYDLQDDKLYSVKFYKNSQEFYRYSVPEKDDSDPENKYFYQIGIYIDLKRSNATHVFLVETDLNSEGTFGCEVTTYSFQTFYREKDMRVYVLPIQKQLQIVSHQWQYRIGDHINVTCVSPPSKPSVSLAWFINGVMIKDTDEQYNLTPAIMEGESDSISLITSLLTIEFVVNASHLANGVLTLQCSALIWQIFGVPFEEIHIEEQGTVTINGFSENYDKTIRDDDLSPPLISSRFNTYKIGDTLDVNCILKSSQSYIVYLEWFINDNPAQTSQVISYTSTDLWQQLFKGNQSEGSSILELKFRITKKHYQTRDNILKLRCLATHGKVLWKDNIQLSLISASRQSSNLTLLASRATTVEIALWTLFLCCTSSVSYYLITLRTKCFRK